VPDDTSFQQAFSFARENDVPSVRPTAFENPWEKKKGESKGFLVELFPKKVGC